MSLLLFKAEYTWERTVQISRSISARYECSEPISSLLASGQVASSAFRDTDTFTNRAPRRAGRLGAGELLSELSEDPSLAASCSSISSEARKWRRVLKLLAPLLVALTSLSLSSESNYAQPRDVVC